MTQGERIRKIRLERGLSQTGLARLVGCTSQRISNFERDATVLPVEMAAIMADAFGVSIEELAGDEMPDIVRLSEEEKSLLLMYRGMDRRDRELLIRMINLFRESMGRIS